MTWRRCSWYFSFIEHIEEDYGLGGYKSNGIALMVAKL